jgi:ABC-type uncharacterized transport system auxiliary subunit
MRAVHRLVLRGLAVAATCLVAGGCSLAPVVAPPTVFDIGALPVAPGTSGLRLRTTEVSAAPWLTDTGMAYRLQFRDGFQREVYRDSRWAAPPAALVNQRLRMRLAQRPCAGLGGGEAPTLQITLDEFGQVFESPTRSHGLVRLRASLGAGPETAFEARAAAPSADERGAVQALALAVDQVLDGVVAWALRSDPSLACAPAPAAEQP